MSQSITSLIATGTKLYLDSVEPQLVDQNLAWGAVGATSNPAIISSIVKSGGFDDRIEALLSQGKSDEDIAWTLTDELVKDAQGKFQANFEESKGNSGYVSFELDPLLEDPDLPESQAERSAKYIELGKSWAHLGGNRMIKVPATEAGLAALEELAAAGVTLNVTLIFTEEQYIKARDAVWAGAQRHGNLDSFKSVYSIFISRIDVYTEQEVGDLSEDAQGQVGLLNAKRIWKMNKDFWSDKSCTLEQELIFASTGVKNPEDSPIRYVQALAGSDIQTNPPETNEAVDQSGVEFTRTVDDLPSQPVQDEIDQKLDVAAMHETLMSEGVDKFIKPQRALLALIAEKRQQLTASA
ncbi:MAG: transaldolase family protein [Planctomycetota bacterium]